MYHLQNKKIVIAGGSGFMGQAMVQCWGAENEVVILTRSLTNTDNNSYGSGKQQQQQARYIVWDAQTLGEWTTALEGCDILINLTGKSVNCRYTAANKKAIMDSRVHATQVLGQAIGQCQNPPQLWVNAASATIYRHATDRPQDEYTGEMHDDFSVLVCKAWEQAFEAESTPHTRKAVLRTAITLGHGGVMVPFKRLTRLGLGGPQGNGRQMFSWIHIADVCRIMAWLWANEAQQGVYNAAAPHPVTNAAFMKTLRSKMGMPFGLPAPTPLLRLGAWLIGTEAELLLKSRWVLPTRLMQEGFTFTYPTLPQALDDFM